MRSFETKLRNLFLQFHKCKPQFVHVSRKIHVLTTNIVVK